MYCHWTSVLTVNQQLLTKSGHTRNEIRVYGNIDHVLENMYYLEKKQWLFVHDKWMSDQSEEKASLAGFFLFLILPTRLDTRLQRRDHYSFWILNNIFSVVQTSG